MYVSEAQLLRVQWLVTLPLNLHKLGQAWDAGSCPPVFLVTVDIYEIPNSWILFESVDASCGKCTTTLQIFQFNISIMFI